MIVLSHWQAIDLIEARGKAAALEISLDLGLTSGTVNLGESEICPGNDSISWEIIAQIADNENNCFIVENGRAEVVQEYSETYERIYTLYPTRSAPTMLISGIPMHRIKGTDPWQDTISKMKAYGRLEGHILDTTTGLGYTAIMAADSADKVTTIELDPAVHEIAKKNPWSQPLFSNPKIEKMIGDCFDLIGKFPEQAFDGIIHDPPMFSLAGDLYSLDFYRQVIRILKKKGRMFHYIGNPESRSGRRVTSGVIQRLKAAGFSKVVPKPGAFGVVAFK